MTRFTCRCGQYHFEVADPPMLAVDCCCTSCRTAAHRMQALPGAPHILGPHGETRLALYRKDRVTLPDIQSLRSFTVQPGSKTRRVLAPCCNTPLFLDFTRGHWLSLYGTLWPEGQAPDAQLRTMTSDLAPEVRASLPTDMPNPSRQNFVFFRALMGAWAAMGFRIPKLDIRGHADV